MEVHPLVTQLRFARGEFVRCLEGVSAADAVRRLEPMNCLSWIVGHMAAQEHFLWVMAAQGDNLAPDLHTLVGTGRPPSTPPWDETWDTWHTVTRAADEYLNTLAPETLHTRLAWRGKPWRESVGTVLLRNIFHYWFHTGEAHAVRQMLGHEDLPQFVGDISNVHFD
jgi:hypothetical protein